eukprot:2338695-Pleurochrysis_carterae.AAC.2
MPLAKASATHYPCVARQFCFSAACDVLHALPVSADCVIGMHRAFPLRVRTQVRDAAGQRNKRDIEANDLEVQAPVRLEA